MKKIFTLLLSVFAVCLVMAQERPTGEFAKFATAPEIDGVVDEVWTEATVYNIDKPYRTEVPTVGEEGETTWQGGWVEGEGVYILLKVTDDAFFPAGTGQNNWEYDKPEIYFDVNFILEDGKGAGSDGRGNGSGHYQVAPGFTEGSNDGTPFTLDNGVKYAFMVDGTNYIGEYFVPFTLLLDGEGNEVAKTDPIGFDVTIIDRDPDDTARRRMVWANIGGKDESWSNMDDAGHVAFEGAEPGIDITAIVIAGPAEVTADNGTAQFTATITPADATQPYKWEVTNGTGMATINGTGLLTAQRNGTVSLKAVSADGFISSNVLTVTISNQNITMDEINIIKNGNFMIDDAGTVGVANWGRNPADAWTVQDGWLTVTATPKTNIWDVMAYQAVDVDATTKYIVKFKAKGSVDMAVPFIQEDISNDYNKAVTSASPYRTGDFWTIPVTTEAKWFEFDITHSAFVENSKYQISWQVGMLDGTLSIDSVMMFKESDLALVGTSSESMDDNQLRVYPNPVGDGHTLYIELSEINSKVAIYNSVGQKLMEGTATGNLVKFDVSALRKGMYFVKTSDGAVQKFMK